jgi:prolyl-tRNA synthetase
VKSEYASYRDFPVTLYQIQTKYRDEARPRAGLLRGREFVMKDSYSFDLDDDGLQASYDAHRVAYQRIFERLGLDYRIAFAVSGAMGGSASEEFLHPTPIGEDTFVRSGGGYAANVEAFTTVVPDAIPFDGLPAPVIFDSPDTPTIDTLVAHANAHLDGEYTAADTLKNVVLALTHLDGTRELVVVGVPGDREVDDKRVEVAFAPAEVEPATPDDFEKHPLLVKGYIGPWSETGAILGEESATGIRYFLDPRVVDGSSWITGANIDQKHVHSLVAGRDFTADGFIEVASVREGDPAPDGSGPVHLARGMEIGHVFQLGRKYADALGLKVLDENGKQVTVTMGSYGIGVTRILAIIAELNNDEKGLVWPESVAPFDVHVIATGKDAAAFELATSLSADLEAAGFDVLYDDRPKVSPGVKFADAELIGVPRLVIVGRGAAEGQIELWDRRSGDREVLPVADAVARLTA